MLKNNIFLIFILIFNVLQEDLSAFAATLHMEVGEQKDIQAGPHIQASPKGLARLDWNAQKARWKVTAQRPGIFFLSDDLMQIQIHITKPEKFWACSVFQCTPNAISGVTDSPDIFFKAFEETHKKKVWNSTLSDTGQKKWMNTLWSFAPQIINIKTFNDGRTVLFIQEQDLKKTRQALKNMPGFSRITFIETIATQLIHLKTEVRLTHQQHQKDQGLEPTVHLRPSPRIDGQAHLKSQEGHSEVVGSMTAHFDLHQKFEAQSQNRQGWSLSLKSQPILGSSCAQLKLTLHTTSYDQHLVQHHYCSNHHHMPYKIASLALNTHEEQDTTFWPFQHIPFLSPLFQVSKKDHGQRFLDFWVTFSPDIKK